MYVLERLGYHVEKACLVHINREYIRGRELEIEKLFAIEELTGMARQMQGDVHERVQTLKACILNPEEPCLDIGLHCWSPYDCGFWKHCTEALPPLNVFYVSGMQKKTKIKYYALGIVSFEDLLNKAKLNPGQKMQLQYELEDTDAHIEPDKIKEFLDTLTYPLYLNRPSRSMRTPGHMTRLCFSFRFTISKRKVDRCTIKSSSPCPERIPEGSLRSSYARIFLLGYVHWRTI